MRPREENGVGRRESLLFLAGGGLGLFVACKHDENPGEKPGPRPSSSGDCAASVDDASKAIRKALQYKARSDQPAKLCASCVQFVPEKYGACGGGCKLINGPVNPGGSCLSFSPVTTDAAFPAKPL